jgi:hypothetical protein
MTTQIVPSNGRAALAAFGERDDIREMTDRLTKMLPGTVRLTQQEALTVAQVAVAHGLDPFNGEVWGLKGENEKWYGVMVGIKGLRKCARRQADQEGGTYWTEVQRVDPKKYNVAETAVVYECRVRDTITTQAYGKSLHTLTTAGIPYAEAVRMLGDAPCVIGVGIATPDERSKMSIHARAKKRAEAEALRQRFDVQLMGVQFTDTSDDIPDDAHIPEAIEGEFTQPATVATDKQTEAQIMLDMGYDPQ